MVSDLKELSVSSFFIQDRPYQWLNKIYFTKVFVYKIENIFLSNGIICLKKN